MARLLRQLRKEERARRRASNPSLYARTKVKLSALVERVQLQRESPYSNGHPEQYSASQIEFAAAVTQTHLVPRTRFEAVNPNQRIDQKGEWRIVQERVERRVVEAEKRLENITRLLYKAEAVETVHDTEFSERYQKEKTRFRDAIVEERKKIREGSELKKGRLVSKSLEKKARDFVHVAAREYKRLERSKAKKTRPKRKWTTPALVAACILSCGFGVYQINKIGVEEGIMLYHTNGTGDPLVRSTIEQRAGYTFGEAAREDEDRLVGPVDGDINSIRAFQTFMNAQTINGQNGEETEVMALAFQTIAHYRLDLEIRVDGALGNETYGLANRINGDGELLIKFRAAEDFFNYTPRTYQFNGQSITVNVPTIAIEHLSPDGRKRDYQEMVDEKDPILYEFTKKVVRGASTPEEENALIIDFVQGIAKYRHEPGEFIKHPLETLRDGGGDCEDKVVLAAAMMKVRERETKQVSLKRRDHRFAHRMLMITGSYSGESKTIGGIRYFFTDVTGVGWKPGQVPTEYVGLRTNPQMQYVNIF